MNYFHPINRLVSCKQKNWKIFQKQFYSSSCKNARYILQIAAWVLKQEVQHIFSHTKESTVQNK